MHNRAGLMPLKCLDLQKAFCANSSKIILSIFYEGKLTKRKIILDRKIVIEDLNSINYFTTLDLQGQVIRNDNEFLLRQTKTT